MNIDELEMEIDEPCKNSMSTDEMEGPFNKCQEQNYFVKGQR